ncbi:MAG: PqqD family protein [Gemmatimonadota bacterium]
MTADFLLPKPSEAAIFKALPDGGVLFSTTSEVYFGVNAVGARIWELLPPQCTRFEELVARLAVEYKDVTVDIVRADARRFIDQLVSSGLARANESGSATSPAAEKDA